MTRIKVPAELYTWLTGFLLAKHFYPNGVHSGIHIGPYIIVKEEKDNEKE